MALSNLATPGVYIQEISTLPPTVSPVSTAIPAFIGYTEKGTLNVPTRIESLVQYEEAFGFAFREQYSLIINIDSTVAITNTPAPYTMYYHLQMYFANGGGPCYIISVGTYNYSSPGITATDFTNPGVGISQAEKADEITLLLAPEAVNIDSGLTTDADIASVHNAMLIQCNKLKDRFCIFDVISTGAPTTDAARFRDDNVGTNYLNYGAAYYPPLDTVLSRRFLDGEVIITTDNRSVAANLKFNTAPNNRLASILNGIGTFNTVSIPGSISAGQTLSIDAGGTSATLIEGVDFTISSTAADLVNVINQHPVLSLVVRAQSSSPTAFFVVVRKPTAIITTAVLDITETGGSFNIGAVNSPGTDVSQNTALYNSIRKTLVEYGSLTLPPSGTMAGIYAAVDNDRGVWKAPANVSVANISGPSFMITEAQQGGLNVDPGSGKSINAIRTFVGRGTLVWGARTLEGNSNEWRYVPVRRLFIMAEESCKKASEFVVFEPNDKNTWIRVKGMITNFLTDLWKQGALAGTKPEQAFFVQVGLGETMTAQDILEGRLIVTIGMAAVRPAEFIILQFTHKLQES
jgi:uncharacterized protein